ncbi:DUF5959 family protein [Streptomyces halstedii]|uniref:DUF5959 family protein n=1 Tax=Streptomyces halstedii TaxID=1944 RepID=UPI0037B3368D
MDTNTRPGTIELIRLADPGQSVSVRLRSAEPALESLGVRYYDAEAVVTSDFVNGTVHLGFDSEDLSDWGQLLDAVEEAERDAEQAADPEEPFAADWPRSGRTAYPRVICGDPYVVEVRDGRRHGGRRRRTARHGRGVDGRIQGASGGGPCRSRPYPGRVTEARRRGQEP